MQTNHPPLLKFEIVGLHGARNIIAEFTDSIKILVDENGTGKTTVLYLLVNLLSGNLSRLSKYSFDSIRLTFPESTILVSNDEINTSSQLGKMLEKFPRGMIFELVEDAIRMPFPHWNRTHSDILEHIGLEIGISPRHLFNQFEENGRAIRSELRHHKSKIRFEDPSSEINKKLKKIREAFPFKILYFPTYRLVEENRFNIGVDKKRMGHIRNSEVQFGMDIVRRRLNLITDQIRKSSVEWYSRISGQMLGQLIGGLRNESIDYENVCRAEALKIVLDRIGPNVSETNKSTILQLVQSEKIKEREYEALAYFLSNLITIYEQQQAKDESIKTFVDLANGYLSDKEIVYDESKLEIYPINSRTQRKMTLDKLSSGEKQIVSIFSRLYLDNPKPYAIFFDEPELSLSLEWQRKLLQDIVDSDKCAFLLAATHSPFIFENRLAPFADVLQVEYLDSSEIIEDGEEEDEEDE